MNTDLGEFRSNMEASNTREEKALPILHKNQIFFPNPPRPVFICVISTRGFV